MRYFIRLSYNGTPFHGWQSQPNAVSVQATIEAGLSKVLRQRIAIVGAGRTDTGVHAREMFAHFDCEQPIVNKDRLLLSTNSLLGPFIAVQEIFEVAEEAHARFDASQRTYKYFVTFSKNPFLGDFSWKASSKLDFDKMNEAAEILLHNDDFTSFAKLHSDAKTNICDVRKAIWQPIEKDTEARDFLGTLNEGVVFTISADRFLRNMVRAVVGTLVEVGRGKMSLNDFRAVIEEKNRCSAGTSMPAHALFLWKISYPFLP